MVGTTASPQPAGGPSDLSPQAVSAHSGAHRAYGKLLACPFCGGDAAFGRTTYGRPLNDVWWDDGSEVTVAHKVNCVRCSANNGNSISGGYRTQERAAAAWNVRKALGKEA